MGCQQCNIIQSIHLRKVATHPFNPKRVPQASALLRAKVAAAEYALASIERSEGTGSTQRAL